MKEIVPLDRTNRKKHRKAGKTRIVLEKKIVRGGLVVVHIFNNYEWWNCGMKINTSYLFTGAVSFYIEPV